MKRINIILIASLALLASCSITFYQMYNVTSDNVQKQNGRYSYEDNQIRIEYNLWSVGGDPGFLIYNKTDEFVSLNLARTQFIKNKHAYDYFQGRTLGSSSLKSQGVYRPFNFGGLMSSSTQNESVSRNETEVMIIPPHSYKTISEFRLIETAASFCDLELNPGIRKPSILKFDKDNTPLAFANVITYRVGDKSSKEVTVINQFWIIEIANYSGSDFTKLEYPEVCGRRSPFGVTAYPLSDASRFYISYNSDYYPYLDILDPFQIFK